jgi:hypothetical protein
MVAARSGNDGATGAALQPGGSTRGRRYGCRARWARCPCRGCDTPRSTVGACSAESGGGFVWPVTLRSVGGADARWITGHVAAAQPVVDWGGNPRHSARPPALWNLIPGVNSIRLLQQGGEISQPRAWGTVSAHTRCSCAVCHTPHGALRGRQRFEHTRQRPRGSGAWAASRAHHPEVRRGSSLRATDSSDPLSALLASSSSMSSRSHTPCRRI